MPKYPSFILQNRNEFISLLLGGFEDESLAILHRCLPLTAAHISVKAM